MKTAISIPDDVFIAAEKTAKKLGISRSELYANAVSGYIEAHVSKHITEKLDELYSSEASSLDGNIQLMQRNSLEKEDW